MNQKIIGASQTKIQTYFGKGVEGEGMQPIDHQLLRI